VVQECTCLEDRKQGMDQLCVAVKSWQNQPSRVLLQRHQTVHGAVDGDGIDAGIDIADSRSRRRR
jgi:hypothetical protein